MHDWNGTPTSVLFSNDTSQSSHYLGQEDAGNSGWSGYNSVTCTSFFFKRSTTYSRLDTYYLAPYPDPPYASYQKREGVASHELGHFIGLGHSNEEPAVMNESNDGETYYSPQEDDECGVNDRYVNSSYPVTCD
ncbi:MAG: matrixin family metalloprotease [SAR202 cluster bacterium]|nr:matrixin family metalloprotease [SAR202 cluster bacterium]